MEPSWQPHPAEERQRLGLDPVIGMGRRSARPMGDITVRAV
ncbi:hypothetical protein [Nocardia sp. NPDC051463]